MAQDPGNIPDTALRRGPGRILFDTLAESILTTFFFVLRFIAWSIRWSMAVVVFLLVMAGAGYYVFMNTLDGGQYVTVPNIENMPITEAASLLMEKGLELGQQQVPHPKVPKYYIISQRPAPNRVVRTGRKVFTIVSIGNEHLKAPDLTHKKLNLARREIAQSRFQLGSLARIPHELPRDVIIAQDPPPNSNIPNRGNINLLVSAGTSSQTMYMPDIRNLPVDRVMDILTSFNVTVIPEEITTPGARLDVVLNQDPKPGTVIYEGQVVSYQVKPSGDVELPDTSFKATIEHPMLQNWFDRDVRVDLVDRWQNRQTFWAKPPQYDDRARQTYVAGTVLKLKDINYVGEATIEIYIDGVLTDVYQLKNGEPPVRAPGSPLKREASAANML